MDHLSNSGIIITIISIALLINTALILFVLLLFWRFRDKLSAHWEELNAKISALQYRPAKVKPGKPLPFNSHPSGTEAAPVNRSTPVANNRFLLAETLKPLTDPSAQKNSKAAALEKVQQALETLEQEISSLDTEMPDETVAPKPPPLPEQKPQASDESDAWRAQLEEVVVAHLGHPQLSTELLAQEMGVSRRQLLRKVKKITGLSTSAFIRQLQMQQSYAIIQKGQYDTVKEVAMKVGFSDAGYFSTLFKAEFGISPSVAIQENR